MPMTQSLHELHSSQGSLGDLRIGVGFFTQCTPLTPLVSGIARDYLSCPGLDFLEDIQDSPRPKVSQGHHKTIVDCPPT